MDEFNLEMLRMMAERTIKKLWILIIILVALLFATNTLWVIHEMSYEEYSVEQEVDTGEGNAYVAGVGDVNYGESEAES